MRIAMRSVTRALLTVVFILALTLNLAARPAQSASDIANDQLTAANVARLLQQSGYSYQKPREGVWVIEFREKSGPGLQIIVAAPMPSSLLIGVPIAQKAQMKPTAEMMMRLLRLNDLVDFVKIGIDKDGDLFVRHEIKTRVLNVQEFKEAVENVARVAQRVQGEVKPYLIARHGSPMRQAISKAA